MKFSLAVVTVLSLFGASSAVKRHDFKTCDQSGFCKRTRALADRAVATEGYLNPFAIDPESTSFENGRFKAGIKNLLFPEINFSLEVRFQVDGVARILMDEVNGLRQRYNETGSWTVQTEPILEIKEEAFTVNVEKDSTSITYANGRHELKIQHRPILLTFLRDGQPHIVINERGLLNMEHFRLKTVDAETVEGEGEDAVVEVKEELFPGFLSEDEDGMWEEAFGGKTDSKPKGMFSLV